MNAMPTPMPLRHLLLALLVVTIWGTNFVIIRVGLDHWPPLLFATLRFCCAWLPAAFFIRRPAARWWLLAAYGFFIGFGQFGLLYIAMNGHISAGLASLVVQSQVFFTIALAMAFMGEGVRIFQLLALAMATAGIAIIIDHGGGSATPLGIALVLVAAASWACGNHVIKLAEGADSLGFVVWSSLFAIPPLLIASWIVEGPAAMAGALAASGPVAWASVVSQSLLSTLFGYAAWNWLLARHPATVISPMAMLVPVFGMSSSALLLGETLPAWKLIAAALVIGGLAVNVLWPRIAQRRAR